jgi:integrase
VTHPVVDPEEWPEAVDLIFVTELGRPVNVNSLVCKHFKPILKRPGLANIRLYDLRHTAATLALTVGSRQRLSRSNSDTPAQRSH